MWISYFCYDQIDQKQLEGRRAYSQENAALHSLVGAAAGASGDHIESASESGQEAGLAIKSQHPSSRASPSKALPPKDSTTL